MKEKRSIGEMERAWNRSLHWSRLRENTLRWSWKMISRAGPGPEWMWTQMPFARAPAKVAKPNQWRQVPQPRQQWTRNRRADEKTRKITGKKSKRTEKWRWTWRNSRENADVVPERQWSETEKHADKSNAKQPGWETRASGTKWTKGSCV